MLLVIPGVPVQEEQHTERQAPVPIAVVEGTALFREPERPAVRLVPVAEELVVSPIRPVLVVLAKLF
jgi:hypothetical protein